MRQMNILKWGVAMLICIGGGFVGFNFKLNSVYQQSVAYLEEGNYEEALEGFNWVFKFKKEPEIKAKINQATYEQETLPIVAQFLNELHETAQIIKTARSLSEIQEACRALKPLFKEIDALDENNDSELSFYLFFMKESRPYQNLKEDAANPSEIGRIEYPTSHSDSFQFSIAKSSTTETIQKILDQEQPQVLQDKVKELF